MPEYRLFCKDSILHRIPQQPRHTLSHIFELFSVRDQRSPSVMLSLRLFILRIYMLPCSSDYIITKVKYFESDRH